jgi:ethanolamine utilization protein EutN
MFLGDVVGTVVTPEQIPDLKGRTQLLVRPILPSGKVAGRVRVAIDTVGAGVGDRVLVLDEGSGARQILGLSKGAVKCLVVGVVDYVDAGPRGSYDHRQGTGLEAQRT